MASTHLPHVHSQMLRQAFGPRLNETLGAQLLIAEMDMIRSPAEIAKITRASELARLGMRIAREQLAREMSERELAERVENAMWEAGADKGGYIYVGADDRSPLAHHPATDNVIREGPVSINIHVSYQGYHADVARTLFLPGNSAEQRAMYDHLRDLLAQTIDAVKPGMTMLEMKRTFYRRLRAKSDWTPSRDHSRTA